MQKNRIRAGITLGDPAGIGPEVALKAVNSLKKPEIIPILIGRAEIVKRLYPEYIDNLRFLVSTEISDTKLSPEEIYFCDLPLTAPVPVPGRGNIDTGRESLAYIDAAIDLWKQSAIDVLITGPVSKSLIGECGIHFTGHTEYIAQALKEDEPWMMMYSETYRVLLVTTHIPLAMVIERISKEKILSAIRIAHRSMGCIDDGDLRIAITGLDPHCGDGGMIGNFDSSITIKAVEEARQEGINVEGPFSSDTLFLPERWSRYNCVIAHYHDQGLIPFKMLVFEEGVNITLGLSMVRTSVDHGTAFDIAGKNIAKFDSMAKAIDLASKMELKKRDHSL